MIFNVTGCVNRKTVVPVCGAAGETVTLTHEKGTVLTVTVDENGRGALTELKFGTYTVVGGTTGYSKTVLVDKHTTMVGAFPEHTYFWHGYQAGSGWTKDGYSDGNHGFGTEASVTDGQLYVYSQATSTKKYVAAAIGMAETVDVTNLSKIVFEVTACNDGNSYIHMGVTSDKAAVLNGTNQKPTVENGAETVAVDVSGLTGEYYVFLYSWVYDYGGKFAKVSRVYGE